jgi:hypothetical protein
MRSIRIVPLFAAGLLFPAFPAWADSAVVRFLPPSTAPGRPGGTDKIGGRILFHEVQDAKGKRLRFEASLDLLPQGKHKVRLQQGCQVAVPADAKDTVVLHEPAPDAKGHVSFTGSLSGIPLGGGRNERGVIGMELIVLAPDGTRLACGAIQKFTK